MGQWWDLGLFSFFSSILFPEICRLQRDLTTRPQDHENGPSNFIQMTGFSKYTAPIHYASYTLEQIKAFLDQ